MLASVALASLPQVGDAKESWSTGSWLGYGIAFVALLAAGAVLAWRLRRVFASKLVFPSQDRLEPPWWWTATAVVFIVVQAGSAAVFDRPDWDDCYYLAAVLDYQHADALNAEEPTHREGLPVSPINRLLAWELWGAVLCRFSGMNPMVLFRTFLPGMLVLLSYAAYWQLVKQLLPRRWVPLAMLVLAGYHAWGISSHSSAANYLLTRIGQGKAVFAHVAVPLLAVALIRYSRSVGIGSWTTLAVCVVFGLAASSSAVFLEPMLVACLGLALLPMIAAGQRLRALIGGAFAVVPPVAYGLLIFREVMADPAIGGQVPFSWSWMTGLLYLSMYCSDGAWEALWLLSLPILGLLVGGRARAYLVWFPLLLLATFANPLLADPVAAFLTSYATYFRVYWLLPIAVGIGSLAALLTRSVIFSQSWSSGVRDGAAFMIASTMLAATFALPGLYVWGQANVGMMSFRGAHPMPDNLMKMPAGLRTIADRLLSDPDLENKRILCHESITNYLTPYSRRFRFVQTRELYTLYMFDQAGRRQEGQERYLLSLFLDRVVPQQAGDPPLTVQHPYYAIPPFPDPPRRITADVVEGYLRDLKVGYVILYLGNDPDRGPHLHRWGFRRRQVSGRYVLWAR